MGYGDVEMTTDASLGDNNGLGGSMSPDSAHKKRSAPLPADIVEAEEGDGGVDGPKRPRADFAVGTMLQVVSGPHRNEIGKVVGYDDDTGEVTLSMTKMVIIQQWDPDSFEPILTVSREVLEEHKRSAPAHGRIRHVNFPPEFSVKPMDMHRKGWLEQKSRCLVLGLPVRVDIDGVFYDAIVVAVQPALRNRE